MTDPGGGISFTSIADLITKIAASEANSLFVAIGTTFAMSGTNTGAATKHPRIYFPGAVGSKVINAGGTESYLQFGEGGGEVHGGKWIGTVVTGDIVLGNKARASTTTWL